MNTREEILKAIGKLEGKIDGVNQRLDKINGSLLNHDDRINVNEHKIDTMSGKIKVIGAIATIILGAVVASIKL